MKYTKLAMLAGIGYLFFSTVAQAELIRITPEGVAVDDQAITDPVPIFADGFRLTYHGGGPKTILDPMVLIFAVPDAVTPGLTENGISDPVALTANITLGGTNLYSGSWDTTTGYAGTYDAATSKDATGGNISVYDYIGLEASGSASENYPNWNGVSGLTSWELWVYTVTFAPDLSRGDWIEFSTTDLAIGSFVVGYGCTELDSNGDCRNDAAAESTPFTYAGYVVPTPVPEPATMLLFGIGIAGLAGSRIRKKKK